MMTVPMNDRELLIRLANAARTLSTVVNNALINNVVQPGYEDMLRGPQEALEAVLALTPTAESWDGLFDVADVEEKAIRTPGDELHESPDTGVELLHRPSGMRRQSISKGDRDSNREVAMRALEQAVIRRGAQRQAP